ncbi:hypothetical protein M2222_003877 [Bradyrhizobium elkanii]|jgi:hypothetical protein|nr:hypothetical protein [Bradyrhizobium elkanii]MCS3561555.1 hypothetical protein [Bradyrhizobium elkanii]MCW2148604.1 hypothetical protein [Bradyrhizobium elkanii]MCW2352310.1 hypothetical protein [Bradyrhizobium elkanii]MCW2372332.1 hypothetical protein [Bradyrhizobium elkanii]
MRTVRCRNYPIADAANTEHGGTPHKISTGIFSFNGLQNVSRGRLGPAMAVYCSVQTLVVFTADSASVLVL